MTIHCNTCWPGWHMAMHGKLWCHMAATYLQQDTRTYGDTHRGVEHSAPHNAMWWYTHHGTLDDIWQRVSTQCYGEVWRCIRGKPRCNKCVNFERVRKDDEARRYVAGSFNTLLYRDWRAMTISGNTWQPIAHCPNTLLYVTTFVITGCNVWRTLMALCECKMFVNVLPT